MIVGYTRVSSFEQNASRQLENQKIEKLFADVVSGKKGSPQKTEFKVR